MPLGRDVDVETIAMPRMGAQIEDSCSPDKVCIIKISNAAGKYAMRSPRGDVFVVPKAEAFEFPSTEAQRRQKELERRG